MTIEQIEVLGKNSSRAFEIYLKKLFIKEFNKINLKEKKEGEEEYAKAASVVSENIFNYFNFEKKTTEADKYFDRYLIYLRNGSKATSFGWLWEYVCAKMLETKYKIEDVKINDPNFDIIFKTEGMLKKGLFKGGLVQCKSSFVSQKMIKSFKASYTEGKKTKSKYYKEKEDYIKKYPNFFYSVFLGLNSQTRHWHCKSSTYFEKVDELYSKKNNKKNNFFLKNKKGTTININSNILKETNLFTTEDINNYFTKDIHKWLNINNKLNRFEIHDTKVKNKAKVLAVPFFKKETPDDSFIAKVKAKICNLTKSNYSLVFDNEEDYDNLNKAIKDCSTKGYNVNKAANEIIENFKTIKGNKIKQQKAEMEEKTEIEEETSYFNY
jgi:hypothetical protein